LNPRVEIVAAARAWLNTPFHHAGRVKGVGVDCLQLLIAVYAEVGLLPAIDVGHYARDWHFHKSEERYLEGVAQWATRLEPWPGETVVTPQPGDLALFTFGRCVSHAAIVIDWPICIHAYVGQGVVEVDAVDGAELAGRLHSFWSLVPETEEPAE
jgi:cell wall-associated NlpC family hydrolase